MTNLNDALEAQRKHQSAVEEAYDYIEHFDLLETITNVGNDEVFTPRKVCEQMLDILPDEVWSNPNYKWLNPCTKNGIFEREIAIRLNEGLKDIIPDEETRKKHILQNMIYSIGLTKFTANVARRALYYCSEANRACDGKKAKDGHYENGYAIGNGTWFDTAEGNILTPITEHVYDKSRKCIYCGINENSIYNDPKQIEHYAYEFIHYDEKELQDKINERFFKGDKNMKFDIIIGNPPYQMADGGHGASAMPIYNMFIDNAKKLQPKYLCMIIPSRWMFGGKGLNKFRNDMLNDTNISKLYDFINSKEVFPNNDIKGGVCYFLRDSSYNGECSIQTKKTNEISLSKRYLKSNNEEAFIRFNELVSIKEKVTNYNFTSFNTIISSTQPYGMRNDALFRPEKYGLGTLYNDEIENGFRIYGLNEKQKRIWKYVPKDYIFPKTTNCLNKFKIFIAQAYGCGAIGEIASTPVLSTPVLSTPGEVCTETFLEIGPFDIKEEAANVIKYIKTKFSRALVGILKQTQSAAKGVYQYVPMQNFTDNSDINWNTSISEIDKQLYRKYNLSDEDISFIEENIQPME